MNNSISPSFNNRPSIDVAEWDFSMIQKTELTRAYHYELVRSCEPLACKLDGLLSLIVGEKSVREHLLSSGGRENPYRGPYPSISMMELVRRYPFFPTPWSRMDKRWREQRVLTESVPLFNFMDFVMQPYSREHPVSLQLGKDYAHQIVCLRRDSTCPKKLLMRRFGQWIDTVRNEGKGPKRGRGSPALPIHKLKALSALRLHKAGYTHEMAIQMLQEESLFRGVDWECPDSFGKLRSIWPYFEAPPEWSKAITASKEMIDEMASKHTDRMG